MTAAERGKANVCSFLVRHGLDANARDVDGGTPLMYAAANLNPGATRVLLRAGANPRSVSRNGDTALRRAARNLNLDALGRLLANHAAAGQTDVNQALFATLDVASTGPEKAGAFWSMGEAFALLQRYGANVRARNAQGDTPFLYAVVRAVSHDSEARPFYLPVLDRILTAGSDINATDRNGETALMAACRANNAVMVSFLVYHKCRVDLQNSNGRTALLEALYSQVKSGRQSEPGRIMPPIVDIANLLKTAGASTAVRDKLGRSALDLARQIGSADLDAQLSRR
jgi:ankyrin repeat protein